MPVDAKTAALVVTVIVSGGVAVTGALSHLGLRRLGRLVSSPRAGNSLVMSDMIADYEADQYDLAHPAAVKPGGFRGFRRLRRA